MDATQGQKSKAAREATAAADKAHAAARDTDLDSLQQAQSAHHTADWKNRDAGNATQAQKHAKAARLLGEKLDPLYRARSFAQGEGAAADRLSKKAAMAEHGPDKDDGRSEKELHAAAAEAHGRAAQAHALAKMPREQAYHQGRAAEHAACARGDASSASASSYQH